MLFAKLTRLVEGFLYTEHTSVLRIEDLCLKFLQYPNFNLNL